VGKRKLEERDIIVIDRATYEVMLQVYKKHSNIPNYEKLRIMETRGVDNDESA